MAVYPAGITRGGSVPCDWTKEVAPGMANSGGAGNRNSGTITSMTESGTGMTGGMTENRTGMTGGMTENRTGMTGGGTGVTGGGLGNWGSVTGGMAGGMARNSVNAGMNSGMAGSGTASGGMETGGSVGVSNSGRSGTADGGTAVTGGTSVRAGWYPGGGYMDIIGRDIENNLPVNEIGAPDSMEEVFRGSMKALLLRNIGNYVVATFLIGTQGTVSWEGILYDVGNDYLAIYQTGRDQYIVSDLYSLKYVEFYDTRRREMCEALMNGQAGS